MPTNKESIPWSEWRVKAQESYVKGKYTSQDMIRDWGYPSDWDVEKNRIIFRKGVPGAYSREARKSNRKNFNSKRSLLSNVSTVDADKESKKLEALHKTLRDESSLFKLSNPDIDELFTEHGISLNTFDNFDFQGASNDPDNRYINGKNNSLLKNEAEEYLKNNNLDKNFVIFNDVEGGNRIESARKFDRVIDNFNQGQIFTSIDEVESFVNNTSTTKSGLTSIQDVLNSRRAIKAVAAASFVPGVLGTAADAAETTMRTELARQTGNPVDYLQAGISGVSTSLGLTNIGDVIGIPLEILNGSIDQHREGLPQIRGRSGAQRAQKRDLE